VRRFGRPEAPAQLRRAHLETCEDVYPPDFQASVLAAPY
jgi:hypothetical protein